MSLPTIVAPAIKLQLDTGTSKADLLTSNYALTINGSANNNANYAFLVNTNGTALTGWLSYTAYLNWMSSHENTAENTLLQVQATLNSNISTSTGNVINTALVGSLTYTLDAAGAVETVNSISLSNDTGISSTDYLTQVAKQTLNGTLNTMLAAGDIVEVSLNQGKTWLQATATTGQNTWSLNVTLTEGNNQIWAYVKDAAGIVQSNYIQSYTLASHIPTVTATESVSGLKNLNSDVITVTTSAEAVSGNSIASVAIYNAAALLGYASANGNGTWSYTAANLADGSVNTFSAVVTDSAGNSKTTANLAALKVATQAPTVTITASATGLVNSTKDTLTITAVADAAASTGNAITTVAVYDGSKFLGNAKASGNGNWSYTASNLADGAHSFTALVSDKAGNSNTTGTAGVTVASHAPTVSLSASIAGLTSTTTDTITVNASADNIAGNLIQSVTIYNKNDSSFAGQAGLQADGTWSYTATNLADGSVNTYYAVVSDTAGNSKTTANLAAVKVASQAPTVAIAESATGLVNSTKDTLTITAVADAAASTGNAINTVAVYDGGILLGNAKSIGNNHWSYTAANLTDGAHSFTAQVTDKAGNNSTTGTASVTVASHAPTVSLFESISGLTSSTTDTITVNASADNIAGNLIQSVTIYDKYNGSFAGQASLQSTGSWTYNATGLSTGNHQFYAIVRDTAGNSTSSSVLAMDQVSATGPAIAISGSLPTISGATQETISVSVTPVHGSSVNSIIIYDSFNNGAATNLGSAGLKSNGVWSYTAASLAQGTHTFSAVITDSLGHKTTETLSTVKITPLPVINAISEQYQGLNQQTSNTITVSANAAANSGNSIASVVIYDQNNSSIVGNATQNPDGSWSFTATGLSGDNNFYAVVTDSAGGSITSAVLPTDVVYAVPTSTAPVAVFSIYDNTLWVTNGTQTGTLPLTDASGNLVGVDRNIYYLNNTVKLANGNEIFSGYYDGDAWLTNGTPVGTFPLSDAAGNEIGFISGFTALTNGNEILSATTGTWVTNGTKAGTFKLTDTAGNALSATNFTALGNGNEIFSSGGGVWVTNGTLSGTIQLTETSPRVLTNIGNITALGKDNAIFSAVDSATHQSSIWLANGTQNYIYQLTDAAGNALALSSFPNFTPFANGNAIFVATDVITNLSATWVINGNQATPLNLTNGAGNVLEFLKELGIAINGNEIFEAYDGSIWVSNGTQSGTFELTDASSKALELAYPNLMTLLANGNYIFSTTGISNGTWITNGTKAGTFQLTDSLGNALKNAYGFTSLANGNEIFSATDAATGQIETWITDGTLAGTIQISNTALANSFSFTALKNGDAIFVSFDSASHHLETWVSNGTQAGTFQLTDAAGNSLVLNYQKNSITALANGDAIFAASDVATGQYGTWVTNGTQAGTFQLTDAFGNSLQLTDMYGNPFNPNGFITLGNGQYLFSAFDPLYGNELWITNGTLQGTNLVKDINTIIAGISNTNIDINYASLNGYFFFENVLTNTFYVADETTSQIYQLTDETGKTLYNASGYTALANGDVIFSAIDSFTGQLGIWVTSSPQKGAIQLYDAGGNALENASGFSTLANGDAIFSATDSVTGQKGIWVSDTTQIGTVQLLDQAGNVLDYASNFVTLANGNLIFTSTETIGGESGIWVTDSKQAGTFLLTNQLTDTTHQTLRVDFTLGNGNEVLSSYDSVSHQYLTWVTNGTEVDTFQLTNLAGRGPFLSNVIALANGNDLFTAYNSISRQNEAWITNGTQAGTFQLIDTAGNAVRIYTGFTTLANGDEIFNANDSASGQTFLFLTNGLANGSFELTDTAGNALTNPSDFTVLANGVEIFKAIDAASNQSETFVTDGTQAGTYQLIDAAGNALINPSRFITFNVGNALFSATDAATGQKDIWLTNGSQAGTYQLTDPTGNALTNPTGFTALANGNEIFSTTDSGSGQKQIWITDGILTDSFQLTDATGNILTNLTGFTVLPNGDVVFSGTDSGTGLSGIWVTNGSPTGTYQLNDPANNAIQFSGNFTPLKNGNVIYETNDANGNPTGIWVTNGNQSEQLTDAAGNALELLYNYNNFTLLTNGDVLFSGSDAVTGLSGIWETDGTTAGTYQLDANSIGILDFNSFTTLTTFANGAEIFSVNNTYLNNESWLTDNNGGIYQFTDASGNPLLLDPNSFIALANGNEIFSATDSATLVSGLWLSNGTKAGTFQFTDTLTDLVGSPLASGNLTQLANGAEIFTVADAVTGGGETWVTDGTQAGTFQLPALQFIDSMNMNFTYLTLLTNGEAIFSERNAQTEDVWVTNGTQVGTFQLTDASGNPLQTTDPNGYYLNPNGFISIGNGQVMFNIYYNGDQNTPTELVITDGTEQGTHIFSGPGTASSSPTVIGTITAPPVNLTGTSNNYELVGGSGNDVLTSGAGNDVMSGGLGADTFVFGNSNTHGAANLAYIMDYSLAQGDLIDLSYIFSTLQPNQQDISNFVNLSVNGNNIDVNVDTTGSGNFVGHEVFDLVNTHSSGQITTVGVQISGLEFMLSA